ncbi:BMP family ABC transporter substrate-binding protein [Spirochaetia bacterium]|nr:BMP family ABC transporter substrate-binding protein [Spirochaetia bacterium]
MKKMIHFGLCAAAALVLVLAGCRGDSKKAAPVDTAAKNINIGVFIPGIMSGSAIYEMLAEGVNTAGAVFSNEQSPVQVTVVEGGFNQAEWESKLTAMAASGTYDLIVSSNPSLPAIAAAVSAKFPRQHFLLLDGELTGNPMIYALTYNQREQAYLAGYIAALVARELTPRDRAPRIGLVAGQEYPAMNNVILPGYEEGAKAATPDATVDFRVVGNWFDAGKGAELAGDMIRGGVTVILGVAGSANEGVVQAAAETGNKVVWFDTNGYGIRPGTVVGSSALYQDLAAYEQTLRFLRGNLPFGITEVVGVDEGYVNFIEDDPIYLETVSPEIRAKQGAEILRIRGGLLR